MSDNVIQPILSSDISISKCFDKISISRCTDCNVKADVTGVGSCAPNLLTSKILSQSSSVYDFYSDFLK